jgi:hypothetical protein
MCDGYLASSFAFLVMANGHALPMQTDYDRCGREVYLIPDTEGGGKSMGSMKQMALVLRLIA